MLKDSKINSGVYFVYSKDRVVDTWDLAPGCREHGSKCRSIRVNYGAAAVVKFLVWAQISHCSDVTISQIRQIYITVLTYITSIQYDPDSITSAP